MNKKHFTITLIIAILAGTFGFFGGSTMASGKGNTGLPQGGRGNFGGPNAKQGIRSGAVGGFLNGTILSKDDQSITLKLREGGSKIIFLSSTTSIDKLSTATVADLTEGLTVTASGTPNTDGSITAKTVQIRPADMVAHDQPKMPGQPAAKETDAEK